MINKKNIERPDWTKLIKHKKIDLTKNVHHDHILNEKIKEIIANKNLKIDLEIDGGINFDNCKAAIDAGANVLVSGSTIFKQNNGNLKKNISLLRSS